MGLADTQSFIKTSKMQRSDLTAQRLENQETLQLMQKHSSNDISKVEAEYAPEEQRIKAEMESMDKNENRDEYQDLMAELKDLKEEKETKKEKIEDEIEDKETDINIKNENLQIQIESLTANIEGAEEMLNQNIEQTFGYFQR